MSKSLFEKVLKILICPQTGNHLNFDEANNKLIADTTNIEYSIIDGIIDFIPEETREHIDSYAKRAKRYEKIIKNPGFFIRKFDKIIWGIKHEDYYPKVISYISDNFGGIILDIPVGTGIFTFEKYKRLSKATIIVADYSINMLELAKKRYEYNNLKNVVYLHADVCKLPIIDKTIDAIISMNGYHAFPNKKRALDEITRVLKTNGQFFGCFYIKGERKRTDMLVKGYYSRRGWFLPPFYSYTEITQKFSNYFNFEDTIKCNSMFIYNSFKSV